MSENPTGVLASAVGVHDHAGFGAAPPAGHLVGMENECFTGCGFTTDDVPYAVVQTNLKSLQLRAHWIYVVPSDSGFAVVPEHWEWVRLTLGQTAATSPDAWAQLCEASDEY